jgi:protein SCO1/2
LIGLQAKRMSGLLLILVCAVATPWALQKWPEWQKKKTVQTEVATVLQPGKPLGHFALNSTLDRPFTDQSLFGQWTLMFFGYADCPKICPQALSMISEIWRSFPEQKPHPTAQFAFVTLNPEHDTVAVLKPFVRQFHADFIGLTGPQADIIRLSKASGVYSWTDPEEDGSQGRPKIIDHSATILLIGPDARLKALFSPPHDALAIARDLKTIINAS